jgi:hypothetical protein
MDFEFSDLEDNTSQGLATGALARCGVTKP